MNVKDREICDAIYAYQQKQEATINSLEQDLAAYRSLGRVPEELKARLERSVELTWYPFDELVFTIRFGVTGYALTENLFTGYEVMYVGNKPVVFFQLVDRADGKRNPLFTPDHVGNTVFIGKDSRPLAELRLKELRAE